ncbi:zinc finger CCCH domain-containing 18 [Chlorella sorokiniana]|uniref:Zinc finger CCCH domain-containing 18 n=1 Tax=Chlorella sorokiniana TaxID=3076 RepID=A0A2P6TZY8_CHLSO|nr:zinc finger CCCH domain-containing 18 [Chlorella sorokiniana]|eukprot:PRW59634.1 zinc finger CCCH domain-containing 18 [Chlorella sorokiniana]
MDLEEQLQEQLAEQQEALAGVKELLEADPGSEETAALLSELQDGIRDTEAALLGLKRQRLLQELDALHGGGDQQHQGAQDGTEGNSAAQAPAVTAPRAGLATHLQPSAICIFRQTDGRHYFGRVLESAGESVSLQPLLPTRAHQLECVSLPAAALQPGPATLEPPAGSLHAGMRAWVQPSGQALWAAAELSEVDSDGRRVAAVLLADKRRHVLPFAAVALHAHAPDPHASDGSGDEGGGASLAAGSLAGGAGDDSGEEDSDMSGSDMSFSGSSDDEDAAGADERRRPGMHRVASAMQDAVERVQQQAEAGAQTDTALFFPSEKHSRGIGSKLLATMGYRGSGHGLGRRQHGVEHALQARRLKPGAGLGVDGGKGLEEGKRKRKGGKQRRRDKALREGEQRHKAAEQVQRELERRTGNEGLFAVLDSLIGDTSQAQAARDAGLGLHSGLSGGAPGGGSSVGGTSRQAHLFGGAAAVAGGAADSKKPANKEEDRRALAQRADALAQLRLKVKRLEEMQARNKRDKVMLPQIERALREARAQLAGAEVQHAASTKAITDKEKLRKMTKF